MKKISPARDAGLQNKMFGIFHDAGYKGLYGGKGVDDIKKFKTIDAKDNLMDRMNTTELAANQFRMTRAREKLHREKIKGQERAIDVHKKVGREVREAIGRIGGTLPEHIPPAEHIKQVEKRIKSIAPRVELEDKDAKGLIGELEKYSGKMRVINAPAPVSLSKTKIERISSGLSLIRCESGLGERLCNRLIREI